tara:strand:- start:96 stop:296 length:201 start_codon:yes stop_codon:yes gene_type:complete
MTDEKHKALFEHIKLRYPDLAASKRAVDCVVEQGIAQRTLGFDVPLYSLRGVLQEFGFSIKPIERQ